MELSAERVKNLSGVVSTSHDGLSLHMLLQGSGSVRIGSRQHPLSPDGYLLVQDPSNQELTLTNAEYVRILIPKTSLGNCTYAEALTPHDYQVDLAIAGMVSGVNDGRVTVLLEALDIAKNTGEWGFYLDTTVTAPLLSARERLLAGLFKGGDLTTIAAQVGYSPFHLQRVFTRIHGLSPASYLAQERVRKACRELILNDDPFEQIAWRCGFRSPTSFAGLFKRLIGHTPSAFRQRGLQFRDGMGFYLS